MLGYASKLCVWGNMLFVSPEAKKYAKKACVCALTCSFARSCLWRCESWNVMPFLWSKSIYLCHQLHAITTRYAACSNTCIRTSDDCSKPQCCLFIVVVVVLGVSLSCIFLISRIAHLRDIPYWQLTTYLSHKHNTELMAINAALVLIAHCSKRFATNFTCCH